MTPIFGLGLPNVPYPATLETLAQEDNFQMFVDFFNRFSNLAISRLEWHNLPKTVSERFLNIALYLYGRAAFFWDENYGFMALPFNNSGDVNVYYEPTVIEAFSINYHERYEPGQYVHMHANPTECPLMLSVFQYAKRISDCMRTIDVVLLSKKRPFLIHCDEKEKLTMLNLFKQVRDNEPLIMGSKRFDVADRKIELLDIANKTDLNELWETFTKLKNELYMILGINAVGEQKRERLITPEAQANNMVIDMAIEVMVKELERACKEINAKWGLDISVTAKTISDYELFKQLEAPAGVEEVRNEGEGGNG